MQHPDIPAGSPRAKILNVLLTADKVIEIYEKGPMYEFELCSAIEDLDVAMSVIPDGWEKLVVAEIKNTQEDPDTL